MVTVLLAGEMLEPLSGRIDHPQSGGDWGEESFWAAQSPVSRHGGEGCLEAGVAQQGLDPFPGVPGCCFVFLPHVNM